MPKFKVINISAGTHENLEKKINDFLETIDNVGVKDIKYSFIEDYNGFLWAYILLEDIY